jgi:predicted TIM-barrel fold metal-dependent hydrolase
LGREAAAALARACVQELGCVVVKMNPAQNAYPIDDPDVLAVVDTIVALGAVAAFH